MTILRNNIKLPEDFITPCYIYNLSLLNNTLDSVIKESSKYDFKVHFAIKSNANKVILKNISKKGLGADCVSGNEIKRALECGFTNDSIVYAGVGKSDKEIKIALENNISCFNCESMQEIKVINDFAAKKHKIVNIAIRINPNVDAHTHAYITTGLNENKFGVYLSDLDDIVKKTLKLKNISIKGLHFHIGSQITDMSVFKNLCLKVNNIISEFESQNIYFENINFGGGLGIEYNKPYTESVVKFENYFSTFANYFKKKNNQQVHFELGRSISAHCGDLLSKVLFIKKSGNKEFAILDAGMSDLLRPALYGAYHFIENISSNKEKNKYDVVGPICESSDIFGKDVSLNKTQRGDYILIHSCGAYGEVMASKYNLRDLPHIYYTE